MKLRQNILLNIKKEHPKYIIRSVFSSTCQAKDKSDLLKGQCHEMVVETKPMEQ
jgi:hypothetical protein